MQGIRKNLAFIFSNKVRLIKSWCLKLGSRLTVGHRPLEASIGVRIPAPQLWTAIKQVCFGEILLCPATILFDANSKLPYLFFKIPSQKTKWYIKRMNANYVLLLCFGVLLVIVIALLLRNQRIKKILFEIPYLFKAKIETHDTEEKNENPPQINRENK